MGSKKPKPTNNQNILRFPSAIVWRVRNTKKIYREVSGKLCVGVHRQDIEGRGEVGLAEGKDAYLSFTPCESIWTTSRTHVRNGCGLHGGERGGDVSTYEIVPMRFNRLSKMQHELLLLLGITCSSFGLSYFMGRANTYSRWKKRGEHPGSRMHVGSTVEKNWPFYPWMRSLQPLQLQNAVQDTVLYSTGKYKDDLTSSPCCASLLTQCGAALPRHLREHKEMLPPTLLQECRKEWRARGQWLTTTVLAFLLPLSKAT